ncbi:superoxide dismutase family protein [Streptomyces sp. DG2A-72]|uniref:superoxide dismutase family protein n=1 Tax=Streptomyces sp. DG2A-72 TaxID=3051386 RepID=UPI00265C1B18|nr:superoxide dismutase family protein [Streptomyces sp. DG2A-72]MDO0932762.1 superoxide dismutase family protein [Streptomyces sp. DG2A-72]
MVAGICAGAVAAAVLAAGSGAAEYCSVQKDGRFVPPSAHVATDAVTYDMALVPAGSWIEVRQLTEEKTGKTTVRLWVKGMKPGHAYGVHVHQKPCAADPAAAGGHYQNKVSTDPADVNAENEVWLDFTAGQNGSGRASAYHDWGFREGEASSVVIHDVPGPSGGRVACFTVPFV